MRLWDLRRPGATLGMLGSNMAAVRSIRFSPDGSLCVAAEAADYVQIYDVQSGFTRCVFWLSRAHHVVPSPVALQFPSLQHGTCSCACLWHAIGEKRSLLTTPSTSSCIHLLTCCRTRLLR